MSFGLEVPHDELLFLVELDNISFGLSQFELGFYQIIFTNLEIIFRFAQLMHQPVSILEAGWQLLFHFLVFVQVLLDLQHQVLQILQLVALLLDYSCQFVYFLGHLVVVSFVAL